MNETGVSPPERQDDEGRHGQKLTPGHQKRKAPERVWPGALATYARGGTRMGLSCRGTVACVLEIISHP